ncbi:MAG: SDR family oxidoreductase [Clostridiaceae bacterium]|nr:SDR family oxidoreductase [Clostridiaceae bacterium]
MNLGLGHKVVAITGGSAGIGKAVAMAFAEEGCLVSVCGRNQERLAALSVEFRKNGYPLCTVTADVSEQKDLERFAEATVQQHGRIDIWINNAGAIEPAPFEMLTFEQWDKVVKTNLKAVYFGSAIAAKHMRISGGGVIINTSSFTSLVPTAGKALYSATKAAVNSLTQTLAIELASDKIRVVGVIPGYVHTEFTAANIAKNRDMLVSSIGLNRLSEPSDLIGAYLFLASDVVAGYISGISLPVTGAKLCTQNPLWSWQKK